MAVDENNTEETPEAEAAPEVGEPEATPEVGEPEVTPEVGEAEATPEVEAPAAEEPAAEATPPVEEAATETPATPEAAPAAAPAREPKRKRQPKPRSERRQRPKPKREKPATPKPIVRLPKPEHERGRRQERRGVVVSSAMDKTIVVKVDTIKAHPRYKKVVRRSQKFHAHDEQNAAKPGDVVRIVETRPISKTKNWRLAEVVEVAQ